MVGMNAPQALLDQDVGCPPALGIAESDTLALRGAIRALGAGAYDWVIFRSTTAVETEWRDVPHALSVAMNWVTVAAEGPATARALKRLGVSNIVMPAEGPPGGLASLLTGVYGPARALLPVTGAGCGRLVEKLHLAGWHVQVVRLA